MECHESGCSREAVVKLYIPWDDDRDVCAAHARSLGQSEGVVADPRPDAGDDLLDGTGEG